jgi:hypothetical protein
MKCTTHNTEAVAVCAYCGRALCPECAKPHSSKRMACSAECAAALTKAAVADDLIVTKSLSTARASELGCYLLGAIFLLCAGIAALMMPAPFLIVFLLITGVGLIIGGVIYGKVTKRQPSA